MCGSLGKTCKDAVAFENDAFDSLIIGEHAEDGFAAANFRDCRTRACAELGEGCCFAVSSIVNGDLVAAFEGLAAIPAPIWPRPINPILMSPCSRLRPLLGSRISHTDGAS